MIRTLAIAGYRSLRDLAIELASLTIVTGANGSGKSSLYRALRLLAETAQGRLVASLAQEGGLGSTLWAGPERFSREMQAGTVPVQGLVRSAPMALKLGFADDDFGFAIDLGPAGPNSPFISDPEIKLEAMWTGPRLGRANLFAERRGPLVRLRHGDSGEWRNSIETLPAFDSMVTHRADRENGFELLMLRERLRSWRFYDTLRTDREAPARRRQVLTYTPVLASDGADLAAALATINAIGDAGALATAIDDGFPGSRLEIGEDADGQLAIRQPGLLRPLTAPELSDGTLRFLLLVAALLSPRPPELMILNEPDASLHPALLPALARLLLQAAAHCQIVLVSHSETLVALLRREPEARVVELEKQLSETRVRDADPPRWIRPSR